MLRRSGTQSAPPSCRRDDHVLFTAHLRLQTPTIVDYQIMLAAASDPAAQHWLGFSKQDVIRVDRRSSLLAAMPGVGALLASPGQCWLIAVDQASGLAAGAASVDLRTLECGGWLAPRFRGQRLGPELFVAICMLGHDHLGITSLRAGTNPANVACVAALQAAGFEPTAGPEKHRLPDGRTDRACWFEHITDQPARCRTRSSGRRRMPKQRET